MSVEEFLVQISAYADREGIKILAITIDSHSHNEFMMGLWGKMVGGGRPPPPDSTITLNTSVGEIAVRGPTNPKGK
jgi:hypothetical protein